jgi:NAD(P)-dependent dehydrogenase (short-subunit alcohol dehydrogenase family)
MCSTILSRLHRRLQELTSLSSLVNNAGVCAEARNPQPIDDFDEDVFDTAMRINARGVFLGCKYAVRQFKKQEPHANGMRGWIVNLASMVSSIGMQGLSKFPVGVSRASFSFFQNG